MRRLILLGVLAGLAGCAGSLASDDDSGDDDSGGDGAPCGVGITFEPAQGATVGDTIYAAASVAVADSFLSYSWTVVHDGAEVPFQDAAFDQSRIRFDATSAGPYQVYVTIGGTSAFCPQGDAVVNVSAPGALDRTWRLRFVTPPGAAVPPQERTILVPGGASYDTGDIVLDAGAQITGTILDNHGAAVPAYLRLTPAGTPDLAIDAFADAEGAFSVRARIELHDLLIYSFRDDIPSIAIHGWTPAPGTMVLDPGTAVSGTVVDASGAPLANASVTVRVGSVPSTLGTTDATGAFTVRARPAANAVVTVDVVPPPGSGLPRLTTTGALLDLAQSLRVSYAGTLATRDLAGTVVEQGGVATSGARVTFTGTIAAAGSLTAGATTTPASGRFAIDAVAGGGGVLPATLVPAVAATAVIDRDAAGAGAPGVVAVVLGTPPATIDAPAGVARTGRVVDPDGAPLATAELRAIPTGALAAADDDQLHVYVAADGTFTLPLAGGGEYELTVRDRAGRLARLDTLVDGTAGSLGDLALPAGLTIVGEVRGPGGALPGTGITIYCGGTCEERDRPVADAVSAAAGDFRATVVDPGVAP